MKTKKVKREVSLFDTLYSKQTKKAQFNQGLMSTFYNQIISSKHLATKKKRH